MIKYFDMYFLNPALEKILSSAKLIIFDLNGLIVDDEKFQFQAFNKVLEKFNVQITRNFFIDKCVGKTEAENFKTMLLSKNIPITPAEIKNFVKTKNQNYQKIIKKRVRKIIRKGVLEIIAYLKNKTNKKVALATSTTKTIYTCVLGPKALNIIKNFDFIICGEEIKNSKPHPEIYLKVKNYFKIRVNECLVFEDSSLGVNAAKNAKANCIAIPNEYTIKQDFSRADLVISDLSQKAKIIF